MRLLPKIHLEQHWVKGVYRVAHTTATKSCSIHYYSGCNWKCKMKMVGCGMTLCHTQFSACQKMTRPASQTGSSTNKSNHVNQSQFNLSNQFLTLSVTVATAAFSILFFFLLLTKRHAGVGGTRYVSCSHACQFYFCVGYEYKHKVGLVVVAAVPGLPVIGNLLQLEKKLYKTFTQMTNKHGPHLFHQNRCFHSHCSQLSPPC